MCALYRVADAMVITSVRDGMNLVAYEYIACQQEQPGTLILSEFAGAAQSLGQCRREMVALCSGAVSSGTSSSLALADSHVLVFLLCSIVQVTLLCW